jgi:hypothetical protein
MIMEMKTDSEIQKKINDCIQNKSSYVEWLCQNKTEKQLELMLKRINKLYVFAIANRLVKHIELIELWKEQINTALKQLDNYGNLYAILKKVRKRKAKLTAYERMIAQNNDEWFVKRIYDIPDEKIEIVEEKMKTNITIRLEETIANAEKYIEQMQQMDDKKLSKHLDLFRQQMEMAYKQNNEEAYKLLYEYETQTIQARIRKNFPDD